VQIRVRRQRTGRGGRDLERSECVEREEARGIGGYGLEYLTRTRLRDYS
jgi:hypothetical protein